MGNVLCVDGIPNEPIISRNAVRFSNNASSQSTIINSGSLRSILLAFTQNEHPLLEYIVYPLGVGGRIVSMRFCWILRSPLFIFVYVVNNITTIIRKSSYTTHVFIFEKYILSGVNTYQLYENVADTDLDEFGTFLPYDRHH